MQDSSLWSSNTGLLYVTSRRETLILAQILKSQTQFRGIIWQMTINSGDFYRQKVATIGGTFQKGDWNTEVNEETKQEMFKEAIALEPTLKVKLCFSASTQLIIKMTK